MRPLRQPEVTSAMAAFAQEVLRDGQRYPMGSSTERSFGFGERVVAKVEWHTYRGATGEKLDQPIRGVSLYVVDASSAATSSPTTSSTPQTGAMRTSQAGLDFIAKWEGVVLHAYRDVAGITTIGVGHVVLPGESFPPTITHEEAMRLLAHDVRIAEAAVQGLAVELAQHEFDALVSFTFNVGAGALRSSTLAKRLHAGDRPAAADQFLMWDRAGGKVVDGLHRRRLAERALFLGDDVADTDRPSLASDLSTVLGQQRSLNAHGASPRLVEDGHWGPATQRAVKVFQAAHGLTADGIVGPLTVDALNRSTPP